MLPHTQQAIHVTATFVYSVCLALSLLLLYYSYVAISGNPGNGLTVLLAAVLRRQQSAYALVGTVLAALPAMALSLANAQDGTITRRGKVYLYLLLPTFLIAAAANLVLEPTEVALEQTDTPALVDAAALQLSGVALVFLTAVLGLRSVKHDAPAAGGKGT